MRLDTFPMGGPAGGPGISLPPTLSCLLHSGVLPPQQELTVWVGGVPHQAQDEDGQAVFSWQCGIDIPIDIHLKHAGRTIRAWRGWWHGDGRIAHTGTLALRVFYAGLLQPAGLGTHPPAETLSEPAASTASDHQNGSEALFPASPPATTAVLEWPRLASRTLPPPAQPASSPEDDLWSRERETSAEEARALDEEVEECEEDGVFEEEEGDEKTTEVVRAEPATVPALQAFAVPVSSLPPVSVPAGTIIAAAHAAQVWSQSEHERVVKDLETVLANLPIKTILIDLRQHSPTPRTSRAARSRSRTMGLTKELLRTLYGARYWDHGTQLTTSRRAAPGRPTRWSMAVDNPASEGLCALLTALSQGFSLLLLDSVTAYAESSRAAVLAVLREHVANLEVGPCS